MINRLYKWFKKTIINTYYDIAKVNEYNLIRFESITNINKDMPLIVNPNPDTIIRVLMEYKKTDKNTKVKKQELTTPTRKGFTVVEWGGTLIK